MRSIKKRSTNKITCQPNLPYKNFQGKHNINYNCKKKLDLHITLSDSTPTDPKGPPFELI